MTKTVSTEKAPKAIGPYSQAVVLNGMAYLSGQIPTDPVTNQLVEGDIAAQTERVILNLNAGRAASPGCQRRNRRYRGGVVSLMY
jgi:2-iminobutanoate/2-iminopropanoate deaminase